MNNATDSSASHIPRRLLGSLVGLGRHWAIVVITAAFVALGSFYLSTTPVFETPDEPWHYRYIEQLATGQGLSPLAVSQDEWEQGEAHQPPLYYALGALLTRGMASSPAEAIYMRNPYAALGLPHSVGNKNAVLHTGGDDEATHSIERAVHRLRWFGVLCSSLTVLLTYLITLEIAPRRRAIALGAASLVGFNPQFAFISAGVNNDSLVTLLATWVLYLSVCVAHGKGRAYRTPSVLGVAVGLAALTKLSGLTAAVLVLGAYILAFLRRPQRRFWEHLLRPVLLAGGVAATIGAWWYIRNAVVYHDPLGMRAMSAAFSIREQALPLHDVLRILIESIVSYWGVFGWMNILADGIYYTAVQMLTALGVVGLVLALAQVYWQRKCIAAYRWQGVVLLAVWILVMMASLVRWTELIVGPQGRLLFPAISAISLFLIVGLTAWVSPRYAPLSVMGLSLLLAGASAVAPFRYIAPAYTPPVRIALEQVPFGIQGLDVNLGDELFLLGYEMPSENITVGDHLHLRLYWLAKKAMREDYTFYVHVFGRKGERIGGVDTYPGGGNYPTRMWLPGEVLPDDYAIPIDPNAIAPTAGVVRVGVYAMPGIVNLPAVDARGREIGTNPEIARVRVAPVRASGYRPEQERKVNLGQRIALVGYDLAPATPVPGNTWEITLYWKALVQMATDYTVFVHLLDAEGQKIAQVDEQPVEDDYPTHLWQMGESVRDVHRLPLPQDLPTGDYMLSVGLYVQESGERLAIADTNPPQTQISLGPVRIEGK